MFILNNFFYLIITFIKNMNFPQEEESWLNKHSTPTTITNNNKTNIIIYKK